MEHLSACGSCRPAGGWLCDAGFELHQVWKLKEHAQERRRRMRLAQ